jgi:hypothetical protein
MLQQTRLDEQVLSVKGSSMLSDLVDEHPMELDPFLDEKMAMQQIRRRGQADSTRHFEPVGDLPRVEALTEYVR